MNANPRIVRLPHLADQLAEIPLSALRRVWVCVLTIAKQDEICTDSVRKSPTQAPPTSTLEANNFLEVSRTGVSGDFILWERWSHVVSNEQKVPARAA